MTLEPSPPVRVRAFSRLGMHETIALARDIAESFDARVDVGDLHLECYLSLHFEVATERAISLVEAFWERGLVVAEDDRAAVHALFAETSIAGASTAARIHAQIAVTSEHPALRDPSR